MEEALHLADEAIRLAPSASPSFYTNQAAWLLAAKRPADASRAVASARRLNDADWADQLDCALAFGRLDAEQVEAHLKHMRSSGSLAFRGKVFLLEACWRAEQGRPSDAETLLREGLRFDAENGQPLSSRLSKTAALAKLYLRQGRRDDTVACCREILRAGPELRLILEAGALLARAGNPGAARRCVPEGLPTEPPTEAPKTLPRSARPEWMTWPIYWRRILTLWAEIALAEGASATAMRLLTDAPPGEYREEWPEALVRASLASRERMSAQFWLQALAANPGAYWLWTEVSGPGFLREASTWAGSMGGASGDWTAVRRFLNQTI
jgi:tetratricopeptide (TPR) repeat protein